MLDMATLNGLITIDHTCKPVELLFTSSAEISYISEDSAAHLSLPLFDTDKVTVFSMFTGQFEATKNTYVDLTIGSFRHRTKFLVVPGWFKLLVLGLDWAELHNPHIDSRRFALMITINERTRLALKMKLWEPKGDFKPQVTVRKPGERNEVWTNHAVELQG